jgi:hypothetical protein
MMVKMQLFAGVEQKETLTLKGEKADQVKRRLLQIIVIEQNKAKLRI